MFVRETPLGSVAAVNVNIFVCMSPSALVLMQLRPPLAFPQNRWFARRLMVAIDGSAESLFLPSMTTMTVTPRVCAPTRASAIQSMLSEWIVPLMVDPAGAELTSRRSSLWIVKSRPSFTRGLLKCAQTG
jgi:hypothetical protein